jgi:hypothetical protein
MRDLGIVYIAHFGLQGVTRATNSQDGEKSSRSIPHPPRRIRDARPRERRKKEKESKEKARALGHRHLINTALPDRPAVTTPYLFQRWAIGFTRGCRGGSNGGESTKRFPDLCVSRHGAPYNAINRRIERDRAGTVPVFGFVRRRHARNEPKPEVDIVSGLKSHDRLAAIARVDVFFDRPGPS